MHAIVNIALRAARDAAELIARTSERLDRVKAVGELNGRIVTSMERDAERAIIYHLQKAYPDYAIESTLSGRLEGKDPVNVWFIDPLNGSANANRGYTHFAVSVALATANRIAHGVLINPLSREEFTASRGAGAQLNATRVRVSKADTLENACVALDAHPGSDEEIAQLVEFQRRLLHLGSQVRLGGASALDLAYVAAGKLDAGWTREQDPCTLSAAMLILQESGALISDQQGQPVSAAGSREMIFGNPRCFKQMLQLRQTLK
jgi:myo-inositol-1(or 4)-monophosphatase